jgi:16S rRNA (cytidine1402-2'-O)-methyltransferase
MGDERRCAISRELTKLHEEKLRGTFAGLIEHFSRKEPRGEMVVVIEAMKG